MLKGCDISHHQGKNFDFSGEDFVIAKATEGKTFIDNCFLHNMERALDYGKCIGAYHYARPENNSAKDEAKHFVEIVKPYVGRCLLALDWEGVALSYPIDWAVEWLKEVELLTGVKPVLYCSASYVGNCKKVAENGNGIWIAKWSEYAPSVKPTFQVMALWQYTNRPYDKDKFFGDKAAWQKYCESSYDTITESGNGSCGCEFCDDFKEWLREHGYVKSE